MRPMPDLGSQCVRSFNESLQIASATETLWLTAPPASVVRKQLKVAQMEALYEATYLRVFSAYESFLEKSLARFMAGYTTPAYVPVAAAGSQMVGTVKAALGVLYGGRRYLLWHDAKTVIKRSRANLVGCPVESVLAANKVMLDDYAAIRHHIAHNSTDSAAQFTAAALRLTGSEHGKRPGRLLRAPDISDPLNQPKWIRSIVDDLSATVLAICP